MKLAIMFNPNLSADKIGELLEQEAKANSNLVDTFWDGFSKIEEQKYKLRYLDIALPVLGATIDPMLMLAVNVRVASEKSKLYGEQAEIAHKRVKEEAEAIYRAYHIKFNHLQEPPKQVDTTKGEPQ